MAYGTINFESTVYTPTAVKRTVFYKKDNVTIGLNDTVTISLNNAIFTPMYEGEVEHNPKPTKYKNVEIYAKATSDFDEDGAVELKGLATNVEVTKTTSGVSIKNIGITANVFTIIFICEV